MMHNSYSPSPIVKLSLTVLFSFLIICSGQTQNLPYKVAVVYALPKDVPHDALVLTRIKKLTAEMQAWYQIATGGRTFELLYTDTVRVYRGFQARLYYKNNGNWWGSLPPEISVSSNIPIWKPGYITIIWAHGAGWWAGAAQGCGIDCGLGILGVELIPEFNNAQYSGDACSNGTGVSGWPCVPQGALIHEFGHTLGLPHPEDVLSTKDAAGHSVMQTHWNYPNYAPAPESPWGLLTLERETVKKNPFMKTGVDIFQMVNAADIVNLPETDNSPSAGFTYQANDLSVTFTNTTSGAVEHYWTFGNGRTSNDKNPTHTFTKPGIYTVTLRPSSERAMMNKFSTTIIIGTPPCNDMNIWNAHTTYYAGDYVSYNGNIYVSDQFTQGQDPEIFLGEKNAWKLSGPCSTPEIFDINSINVYPNPGKDKIYINYPSGEVKVIGITITDVLSKTFIQAEASLIKGINTIPLNIDHLANGMYTVIITDRKEKTFRSILIMK